MEAQNSHPLTQQPNSQAYFARVSPTYLENWPPALRTLSIAQVDIPLTLDGARALGSHMGMFGERFTPTPLPIDAIARELEEAATKFPNGFVPRLGSRSPKDTWRWHKRGPRCATGQEALELLTDESERLCDDLWLALANDYTPHIFLRDWQEIPAWAEFRCFMRGRELVGISQYEHHAIYPEIAEHAQGIVFAMEVFFPRLRKACHVDDIVFDVFVKIRRRENISEIEMKLLECNPFFERTDPCLFRWGIPDDFDGTFRYNTEEGSE